MFEALVEAVWNPQTFLKLGILAVLYPIWGPLAKAMWTELQISLRPEGGVFGRAEPRPVGRREPGIDPWINVPLARHRRLRDVQGPPQNRLRDGQSPTRDRLRDGLGSVRRAGAGDAATTRGRTGGRDVLPAQPPRSAQRGPARRAGERRASF